MFNRKAVILCAPLLLFLSWLVVPGMDAAPAEDTGSVRVAILPFVMNTPANLTYLQSGVRDMLSSRLASQGKVQVVDKSETDRATKGTKEISQSEALRAGAALKADYVLYGSITSTGQSVTIDAKMVPVSGKTEPVSFYAQTKSLDEVMPQLDLFAQQINQKVFGKPEEKTQTASAEAEAQATRNPELLLPGALASGDKISYMNPTFAEVTSEDSSKQPGFWKSQDFQGGILGMDVGDVDGDGKDEVVAMQAKKLSVYKKANQGLQVVDTFEGTGADRFVWVSVAEASSEGKSYIYLTSLRARNSSKPQLGQAKDNTGQGEDVYSYVMAMSGGKLQVVAEGIPYYLNAIHLGQRGKVLVGQKQGDKRQNPFSGGIFEMQLRDRSLVPGLEVNVPKEANVFNFVKTDINKDKTDEVVLVDHQHKLRILKASGDQLWKGGGIWAATTNAFESKVESHLWGKADVYAIPSPILVTDLRRNGIPEVVVNCNSTSSDKLPSDSTKYYDQGAIVSLSWENMGLTENWKTKELNGQITSIRIGDLDGNGKKQLVTSTVYARDALKLSDSRSVIIAYDLNVQAAAAKPALDERETVPINAAKPVDDPGTSTSTRKKGNF